MRQPTEVRNSRSTDRAGALPGLAALIVLAVALPTLVGTSVIMNLASTGQVVVAAVAAVLAVAVVPATLLAPPATGSAALRVVVLTAALLSAGAAAIHFVVIDMHFGEWWGFGVFFVATGVAQLAWAIAAMWRPTRTLFWIGAIGNGLIVAAWIATRTTGLPFGPDPWQPETIGFADVVATGFEVAIVLLCLTRAARRTSAAPQRPKVLAAGAIAFATIVLTALSLLSAIGAATSIIPPSA